MFSGGVMIDDHVGEGSVSALAALSVILSSSPPGECVVVSRIHFCSPPLVERNFSA